MEVKSVAINHLKTEYITLGKGRDLLFLHGGSVSFRTNLPLIKELSKSFRIWAFSFPGAGKSCKLPKKWKFEDYAEFTHKFVEKFKIKPVLCGHSIGGATAVALMVYHINDFSELFLFAPVGVNMKDRNRAALQVAYNHVRLLVLGKYEMKKDVLINLIYHPLDLIRIANIFKNIDISNEVIKLKKKAIIFWGKDDKVLPAKHLQDFEKNIKNCKSYVVNGGHEFLTENKERISEIVNSEVGNSKAVN